MARRALFSTYSQLARERSARSPSRSGLHVNPKWQPNVLSVPMSEHKLRTPRNGNACWSRPNRPSAADNDDLEGLIDNSRAAIRSLFKPPVDFAALKRSATPRQFHPGPLCTDAAPDPRHSTPRSRRDSIATCPRRSRSTWRRASGARSPTKLPWILMLRSSMNAMSGFMHALLEFENQVAAMEAEVPAQNNESMDLSASSMPATPRPS